MSRIVQKSMDAMRLRKDGERIFLMGLMMIVSTWHGGPECGFGLEPNILPPIQNILLRTQPTRRYWELKENGRGILDPFMRQLPGCETIPVSGTTSDEPFINVRLWICLPYAHFHSGSVLNEHFWLNLT